MPVASVTEIRSKLSLAEALGAVIRAERRRLQLTIKELAERAALSVPYLGEIERGKKYPSAQILERLAQSLEIEVADLLELAAAELRGASAPRRIDAIGFVLPRRASSSPRAMVDQIVDLLAPEDVAMLGEMGAFLAARRQGVGIVPAHIVDDESPSSSVPSALGVSSHSSSAVPP